MQIFDMAMLFILMVVVFLLGAMITRHYIKVGFAMGRQTQDKPVDGIETKMSPATFEEEDPWERATRLPEPDDGIPGEDRT